jgi:hypothetical protein
VLIVFDCLKIEAQVVLDVYILDEVSMFEVDLLNSVFFGATALGDGVSRRFLGKGSSEAKGSSKSSERQSNSFVNLVGFGSLSCFKAPAELEFGSVDIPAGLKAGAFSGERAVSNSSERKKNSLPPAVFPACIGFDLSQGAGIDSVESDGFAARAFAGGKLIPSDDRSNQSSLSGFGGS